MNKIILFDQSSPSIDEFDLFRLAVANSNHKFSKNYNLNNFVYDDQEIFSIGYKDDIPHLFSTVYRNAWWPPGAYRILNRLWKNGEDQYFNATIDEIYIEMISAQLNWLITNRSDFQVAVISRNGIEYKMLSALADKLSLVNLDFKIYKDRVWVCNGTIDDCLQTVLYYGNEEILELWTS